MNNQSNWRLDKPERFIEQMRWTCDEDENGCWIWPGCPEWNRPTGRPELLIQGKRMNTARWMLWAVTGELGEMALHKCDHGCCCNPDHLEWGTATNNRHDWRDRKNDMRGPNNPNWGGIHSVRGETHKRSKLTEEQVREMRRIYTECDRPKKYGLIPQLAEKFGVSLGCVQSVVHFRTWKHVN